MMRSTVFWLARRVAAVLRRTPLRRLPGARRLYAFVYRLLVHPGITVVEAQGSRMYVERRDVGVAFPIIAQGVYEPHLTEFFRGHLGPGMVVVDAGANIGYFALLAARLVGERGRVLAFEPEPKSYELLRRSITLNGYRNITASACALSDRPQITRLFLDRRNLGNPSLAASNVDARAGTVEIESVRLDDFLEREVTGTRVDLMKLDTQGAEGLVLKGARRVLEDERLQIVMEFWPRGLRNLATDPVALLRTLRGHGFEIALLDEESGRVGSVSDAGVFKACKRRRRGGFATLALRR